jgi:hypothetical protein
VARFGAAVSIVPRRVRTMNRVAEYLRPDEAVALLKRGGYLMVQHAGTGEQWFLMPGGDRIRPEDVRKIIHRNDVVAQADGLFPGATPQTWRAR